MLLTVIRMSIHLLDTNNMLAMERRNEILSRFIGFPMTFTHSKVMNIMDIAISCIVGIQYMVEIWQEPQSHGASSLMYGKFSVTSFWMSQQVLHWIQWAQEEVKVFSLYWNAGGEAWLLLLA